MKRIFVAILVLVTLFTAASADGVWHYCDLCGREHSGTICPEQCIDPCRENEVGHIHKWYDCPEYTVIDCWYCGEKTINHNANCCPNGDTVWNDKNGVFKTSQYRNEDGARTPTYCTYCEHYGYHFPSECKKAPKPTKTPKPTNTPRPTVHVHTKATLTSTPVREWVKSSNVCYRETIYITTYCTTCDEVISTKQDVHASSHYFGDDRACDYCGYYKECSHTSGITEYKELVRIEVIGTSRHCRIFFYDYEEVCNECNTVIAAYTESVEADHGYYNGVCVNCGFVIKPTETATPVPTATPTSIVTSVSTATPTAKITLAPQFTVNPVYPTPNTQAGTFNDGTTEFRVAIVLIVTFAACAVIFFAFRKK